MSHEPLLQASRQLVDHLFLQQVFVVMVFGEACPLDNFPPQVPRSVVLNEEF